MRNRIRDMWVRFWNNYFYHRPDRFITFLEYTHGQYDNAEYLDGDDDSGFGPNSYFVRAMSRDD